MPSSARSSASAATPLLIQLAPLLQDVLENVKSVIHRVIPDPRRALHCKTDDEPPGEGWELHEASLDPSFATAPSALHLTSGSSPSTPHAYTDSIRARNEREGHAPRPAVIKRNMPAGDGIKTGFDSGKLPVAHSAYVAKSSSEPCASKKHSPADLDAMGFDGVPWDGQCVPLMLHALPRY